MGDALTRLRQGAKYPYDASDAFWNSLDIKPLPATDWAHHAARGILADLTDRRGIKHGFENIDEDVRVEIVAELAQIIRRAASSDTDALARAERAEAALAAVPWRALANVVMCGGAISADDEAAISEFMTVHADALAPSDNDLLSPDHQEGA